MVTCGGGPRTLLVGRERELGVNFYSTVLPLQYLIFKKLFNSWHGHLQHILLLQLAAAAA